MKYTFDAYGIDQYLYAVNDSAWNMIDRNDIRYDYPVEPIYPLKWFITFGKAPKEFIEKLLKVQPRVIAKIILDNVDEDCMYIIRLIEKRINK